MGEGIKGPVRIVLFGAVVAGITWSFTDNAPKYDVVRTIGITAGCPVGDTLNQVSAGETVALACDKGAKPSVGDTKRGFSSNVEVEVVKYDQPLGSWVLQQVVGPSININIEGNDVFVKPEGGYAPTS